MCQIFHFDGKLVHSRKSSEIKGQIELWSRKSSEIKGQIELWSRVTLHILIDLRRQHRRHSSPTKDLFFIK